MGGTTASGGKGLCTAGTCKACAGATDDRPEDEKRGIVAIVINAIDASLKADVQQVTEWKVDTIKSLQAFLDAAREAGRYVLFASDHGHVPADRLATISSPPEAGARYRRWRGSADPTQPGELAFDGTGVYAHKDMKGAVLLTTDAKRYGGAAHAGEHGGATLAEVVTPCILLGWDEPGMETRHPDLRSFVCDIRQRSDRQRIHACIVGCDELQIH